jgi:ATP-dependent Clp protease ATP-binding subunit ClpB
MNAEKYTQKTIETLNTAQAMAEENGNQYLTPEHLLYALVDQDGGLIGSILQKMGVDGDTVLAERTPPSESCEVSGADMQVYASPETGKLLRFAERSQRRCRRLRVLEHLMLGIFAEPTASIKRFFADHGITKNRFTEELAKVKTTRVTSDKSREHLDALTKYGTDLVARARSQEQDPVIGRDAEIRNVVRILSRKTKNNPVLIGEPGVGKTAIAEGLAQRIGAATCPRD